MLGLTDELCSSLDRQPKGQQLSTMASFPGFCLEISSSKGYQLHLMAVPISRVSLSYSGGNMLILIHCVLAVKVEIS